MTPSSKYYGPGEPWHPLAGHPVEVALGKQTVNTIDLTETLLSSLTQQQKQVMERWKLIFEAKYKVVGHLLEGPDVYVFSLHRVLCHFSNFDVLESEGRIN